MQFAHGISDEGKAYLRKAFRCPCDGISHLQKGREIHPVYSRPADLFREQIAKATSVKPSECPWNSRNDPLVIDVYRQRIKGTIHASHILTDDLPNILYEAVIAYSMFLENAKAHWRRIDAQKREKDRKRAEANRGRK